MYQEKADDKMVDFKTAVKEMLAKPEYAKLNTWVNNFRDAFKDHLASRP